MANLQKLIDLDGLSYFLGQIKAKFVHSVNGVKPDSKGNVNIANMEGATSNVSGKAGLVPIPAAGKQDMALCGDATFKVLPIAGGGTGANNIISAVKNLLQFYEEIPANADLNDYKTAGLYICDSNDTVRTLKNCPTDLAFVLRVEPLYCKQVITLYNSATSFSRYLQDWEPVGWQGWSQTVTTGMLNDIVAANLAQNGYVKFANGLILQWGACNTENYHAFPITFGTVFSLVALPNYNTNRYQNLVCKALDSYGFTVSMSWGDTSVPALFFAIGKD